MKTNTTRTVSIAAGAALAAALLPAPALRGDQKKAYTIDDHLKIAWVSDLQLSPDGKGAVFTVKQKSLAKNATRSWVFADRLFENAAAVKLTSGEAKDWHARYSPDGKRLAFLSTRGGAPQVWALPLSGGEAVKLTDWPLGVSGFSWSPDSAKLLFAADSWKACDMDMKCQAKKTKEQEEGGGRVIDELPFRLWNSWRDGLRSRLFVVSADGAGEPKPLTPVDRDAPPLDLGSGHDFAWSPDGTTIAFVMNDSGNVAWSTDNDVFLVPAAGGTPVKVSDSKGCDAAPFFSPDGKLLAWLSMERAGYEADRRRLVTVTLAWGEGGALSAAGVPKAVAPAMDESVMDFVWRPDSAGFYYYAADEGRRAIRALTLAGKVQTLFGDGYNTDLAVTPDGKSLAFLHKTAQRPADVWRIDDLKKTKPAAPARVTWFNDTFLAGFELGALEELWFAGAKGDKVHAFVMKPPGFDAAKKHPAIFLLHGGPQGDWADDFHPRWNPQLFAGAGYAVVMVNFHGSVGYGQAFQDDVSMHWGDYPYEDIMKGVDHVTASFPWVDGDRLGAAGASYGGYLANWIITHTDRFKAVHSHAGVFELVSDYGTTEELWFPEWEFGGTYWEKPELYEKFSPAAFAGNIATYRTPTLVSHGANDFRVGVDQGLQLYTLLERLGVDAKLMYFPDEDHFVQKPKNAKLFYETAIGWFDAYLKKEPAK